jgi:hypothetical protein
MKPPNKPSEAQIAYELYRLLINVISRGLTYNTYYKFKNAIPEYKAGEGKADLVVTVEAKPEDKPFLVIEVKRRALHRPGPSLASAVRKAREYANRLSARFFCVYDGWNGLVFEDLHESLTWVFGPITEESHAQSLLLGLAEWACRNSRETLSRLPPHRDPESLIKLVFPSVAKVFEQHYSPNELLKTWEQLLARAGKA